jgi:hypothetical protein
MYDRHDDDGNAREILRRVRDTFLGGKYTQYLSRSKLAALGSLLVRLSEANELSGDLVAVVADELHEAGIESDPSLLRALAAID